MVQTIRATKDKWQSSEVEDALVWTLKAVKLPPCQREYQFHPTRKWRFDLAWPDQLLAVEVMGSTWSQGYHTRGKGYEADCEKSNEAVILGWRVLKVTSEMVNDGRALDVIERALKEGP